MLNTFISIMSFRFTVCRKTLTKCSNESFIINKPVVGQRYAVFSGSTPSTSKALHYIFSLPLTALSWRRIGIFFLIMLSKLYWMDP